MVLTLQDAWRHNRRRIQPARIAGRQSRGPESTRSSDQARATNGKWIRSERRIVIKKIGCLSVIQPSILLTLHRTADLHRDRGARDQLIATVHPVVLSSHGADKTGKNPRIAVRSSRDQAAIAAQSSHDRTFSAAESLLPDSTTIDGNLGPRSNPDRGPIVVRSWC